MVRFQLADIRVYEHDGVLVPNSAFADAGCARFLAATSILPSEVTFVVARFTDAAGSRAQK
jgi:hypothetical protein